MPASVGSEIAANRENRLPVGRFGPTARKSRPTGDSRTTGAAWVGFLLGSPQRGSGLRLLRTPVQPIIGVEVVAATSITLTNRAAKQVEAVRNMVAVIFGLLVTAGLPWPGP
jgi:hypothetical protein